MISIILKAIIIILVLAFLVIVGFTLSMGPGAIAVQPDQTFTDVKIQPSEALKIAAPHLESHGTYKWRGRDDRPLKVHIVRGSKSYFSDWYYIKKTNYPAKTTRYYMHGAVKVHPQTGEVEYSPKSESFRSKKE